MRSSRRPAVWTLRSCCPPGVPERRCALSGSTLRPRSRTWVCLGEPTETESEIPRSASARCARSDGSVATLRAGGATSSRTVLAPCARGATSSRTAFAPCGGRTSVRGPVSRACVFGLGRSSREASTDLGAATALLPPNDESAARDEREESDESFGDNAVTLRASFRPEVLLEVPLLPADETPEADAPRAPTAPSAFEGSRETTGDAFFLSGA